MKNVFKTLPAACLAIGLALSYGPAEAQQAGAPAPTLKPGTPACMAAAREILQLKNAAALYANAVPNIVAQTKDQLLSTNLNYQKDLNEVAVLIAQKLAGREKEISEGMAQIYCNEFTEKELVDLVAFYKSAGHEIARQRAPGDSVQHVLYEQLGPELCRDGQWRVPRRNAQAG